MSCRNKKSRTTGGPAREEENEERLLVLEELGERGVELAVEPLEAVGRVPKLPQDTPQFGLAHLGELVCQRPLVHADADESLSAFERIEFPLRRIGQCSHVATSLSSMILHHHHHHHVKPNLS